MLQSIELKQERQRVSDLAKALCDKVGSENRSLTPAEEKEHKSLFDRIHAISADIVKAETEEQREAEAARAAFDGGKAVIGGNGRTGIRYLSSMYENGSGNVDEG